MAAGSKSSADTGQWEREAKRLGRGGSGKGAWRAEDACFSESTATDLEDGGLVEGLWCRSAMDYAMRQG